MHAHVTMVHMHAHVTMVHMHAHVTMVHMHAYVTMVHMHAHVAMVLSCLPIVPLSMLGQGAIQGLLLIYSCNVHCRRFRCGYEYCSSSENL